jgi:hypothetical protein
VEEEIADGASDGFRPGGLAPFWKCPISASRNMVAQRADAFDLDFDGSLACSGRRPTAPVRTTSPARARHDARDELDDDRTRKII